MRKRRLVHSNCSTAPHAAKLLPLFISSAPAPERCLAPPDRLAPQREATVRSVEMLFA
jgi:hypothetical protein